ADLARKPANDKKAKQADKQKIASLGGRQGELRDLLDQLLKQSSGKGLPAKPDKATKLPEEASNEKIEDDELEKQLLQDKPDQDQQQQPQPNPAQQAAQNEQASAANENDARFKNDLKETAENWGQVSPRLHDAVVEGAGEKVPEKYRSLVQDYYRSLATKAT